MTSGRIHRSFSWLLIGVGAVCTLGIWVLQRDAINNPTIEGRSVREWLTVHQTSGYDKKLAAEHQLLIHRDETLPGLIYHLERKPNPVHLAAVKLWNRLDTHRLPVPDYSGLRAGAARVIGQMKTDGIPAVPSLMAAATDDHWNVSEPSRQALLRLSGNAAPTMARRLGRSDPIEHQLTWAAILRGMGSGAANAVPELLEAVGRSQPDVRASILQLFKPDAFHVPEVTAVLVEFASDGDIISRRAALDTLGHYERSDSRIHDVVSINLEHEDFRVQFAAAAARCQLADRPEEVLPVIIEGLKHGEHRVDAVSLLGNLGKIAEPAIPDLVEVLISERNPRPLRNPPAAGVALSRVGNRSLPDVVALLSHEDSAAQLNAVVTLGVFGERAHTAADSLLPLLRHESEEIRQATALTLASIGFHTAEAVPVLLMIAEDDDPFTATWANDALIKIDPKLGLRGPAR